MSSSPRSYPRSSPRSSPRLSRKPLSTSSPSPTSSSTSSTSQKIRLVFLVFFVPYLVSYLFAIDHVREILSTYMISAADTKVSTENAFPDDAASIKAAPDTHENGVGTPSLSPNCERRFRSIMGLLGQTETFKKSNVEVHLHRNGDPQACGKTTGGAFLEELKNHYASFEDGCRPNMNKYQVEAILTATLHSLTKTTCASKEIDANVSDGFLGFCDMGEKKTPILPDYEDLVPVPNKIFEGQSSHQETKTLPCRFHTREGLRISHLKQLTNMVLFQNDETEGKNSASNGVNKFSRDIHLYAVPAGRVFMFAPDHVGEIFNLTHVIGVGGESIYLEALSLEPRVFDIFNFFSRDESEELVKRAIAETSPSHKIKRSTTGAGSSSVNSRRTSESGFDTHGRTASLVKRRCFKALGFDEYWDTMGDGLQILRYNRTTAYNSHLDYIEDKSGQLEHDFDSSGTGGNRFATILMYMSDLDFEDGGETVFPKAWPPKLLPEERVSTEAALEQLRASEHGNVLERGSWEEQLVAKCKTKLSIGPHSSRAVLFYSQFPNGELDPLSLHAACPLLDKQKYAANLWVWNTPRQGYPGAPIKEKFRKETAESNSGSAPAPPPKQETRNKQINVIFTNSGKDESMDQAELYFRNRFWATIGRGDAPVSVNTYQGHVWNLQTNGKVVRSFTISEADGIKQHFVI